jgi:hypothetical protein
MTASSRNESSLGVPAMSYLLNVGLAADRGITLGDMQGLLAGVAPIVGTARVVEVSANITSALGLAVDLAEQLEVQARP